MRGSGRELSVDQTSRINEPDKLNFADPLLEIMLAQDKIMTDLLTFEEITALRDFYATDTGSSVMRKMPDIIGKQQPMVIQIMTNTMPMIMSELCGIVDGG